MSSAQLYDTIGATYTVTRSTEPRIAAWIWAALGEARTVLNVGAGSGSDEPPDRHVLAVEPSVLMRSQRLPDAAPCLAGSAENLPFDDQSFDAAMALSAVHTGRTRSPACARSGTDARRAPSVGRSRDRFPTRARRPTPPAATPTDPPLRSRGHLLPSLDVRLSSSSNTCTEYRESLRQPSCYSQAAAPSAAGTPAGRMAPRAKTSKPAHGP